MYTSSREINLDKNKLLVSRTNIQGTIEYANHDFINTSGYSLKELVNSPHNIVRHPDMPAAIFRIMWDRLKEERDIFAVVKNRAKNGDYYWVTTRFEAKKHPFSNKVTGYVAYRRAASKSLIDELSPLYREMLEIEHSEGIDASEKFLLGFLDTKNQNYDTYIASITDQGGFKALFSKMAKLFQ